MLMGEVSFIFIIMGGNIGNIIFNIYIYILILDFFKLKCVKKLKREILIWRMNMKNYGVNIVMMEVNE